MVFCGQKGLYQGLRKTAYRNLGKQGFYIDRDFLSQAFEHDKGFHWKVVFEKMPSCARAFFKKNI